MGKSRDLSGFDKGQIVMAVRLVRASPKLEVLRGIPSLVCSVAIKIGPREEQW